MRLTRHRRKMFKDPKYRTLGLEDRTCLFAKGVRDLVKRLPDGALPEGSAKMLLRSSTAVDASCVDANEALCKEDYFMRLKMARNEAANSSRWLKAADPAKTSKIRKDIDFALAESEELEKLFAEALESRDESYWPPIEDIYVEDV